MGDDLRIGEVVRLSIGRREGQGRSGHSSRAEPNQRVIVVLRSQFPKPPTCGSHKAVVRATAIKSDQAAIRTQLRSAHATHVQSFQLVNAMAATVSKG